MKFRQPNIPQVTKIARLRSDLLAGIGAGRSGQSPQVFRLFAEGIIGKYGFWRDAYLGLLALIYKENAVLIGKGHRVQQGVTPTMLVQLQLQLRNLRHPEAPVLASKKDIIYRLEQQIKRYEQAWHASANTMTTMSRSELQSPPSRSQIKTRQTEALLASAEVGRSERNGLFGKASDKQGTRLELLHSVQGANEQQASIGSDDRSDNVQTALSTVRFVHRAVQAEEQPGEQLGSRQGQHDHGTARLQQEQGKGKEPLLDRLQAQAERVRNEISELERTSKAKEQGAFSPSGSNVQRNGTLVWASDRRQTSRHAGNIAMRNALTPWNDAEFAHVASLQSTKNALSQKPERAVKSRRIRDSHGLSHSFSSVHAEHQVRSQGAAPQMAEQAEAQSQHMSASAVQRSFKRIGLHHRSIRNLQFIQDVFDSPRGDKRDGQLSTQQASAARSGVTEVVPMQEHTNLAGYSQGTDSSTQAARRFAGQGTGEGKEPQPAYALPSDGNIPGLLLHHSELPPLWVNDQIQSLVHKLGSKRDASVSLDPAGITAYAQQYQHLAEAPLPLSRIQRTRGRRSSSDVAGISEPSTGGVIEVPLLPDDRLTQSGQLEAASQPLLASSASGLPQVSGARGRSSLHTDKSLALIQRVRSNAIRTNSMIDPSGGDFVRAKLKQVQAQQDLAARIMTGVEPRRELRRSAVLRSGADGGSIEGSAYASKPANVVARSMISGIKDATANAAASALINGRAIVDASDNSPNNKPADAAAHGTVDTHAADQIAAGEPSRSALVRSKQGYPNLVRRAASFGQPPNAANETDRQLADSLGQQWGQPIVQAKSRGKRSLRAAENGLLSGSTESARERGDLGAVGAVDAALSSAERLQKTASSAVKPVLLQRKTSALQHGARITAAESADARPIRRVWLLSQSSPDMVKPRSERIERLQAYRYEGQAELRSTRLDVSNLQLFPVSHLKRSASMLTQMGQLEGRNAQPVSQRSQGIISETLVQRAGEAASQRSESSISAASSTVGASAKSSRTSAKSSRTSARRLPDEGMTDAPETANVKGSAVRTTSSLFTELAQRLVARTGVEPKYRWTRSDDDPEVEQRGAGERSVRRRAPAVSSRGSNLDVGVTEAAGSASANRLARSTIDSGVPGAVQESFLKGLIQRAKRADSTVTPSSTSQADRTRNIALRSASVSLISRPLSAARNLTSQESMLHSRSAQASFSTSLIGSSAEQIRSTYAAGSHNEVRSNYEAGNHNEARSNNQAPRRFADVGLARPINQLAASAAQPKALDSGSNYNVRSSRSPARAALVPRVSASASSAGLSITGTNGSQRAARTMPALADATATAVQRRRTSGRSAEQGSKLTSASLTSNAYVTNRITANQFTNMRVQRMPIASSQPIQLLNKPSASPAIPVSQQDDSGVREQFAHGSPLMFTREAAMEHKDEGHAASRWSAESPDMELLRPAAPAEAQAMPALPEEMPAPKLDIDQLTDLVKKLPQLDVSKLADRVYREIEKKMKFDRQRRGL